MAGRAAVVRAIAKDGRLRTNEYPDEVSEWAGMPVPSLRQDRFANSRPYRLQVGFCKLTTEVKVINGSVGASLLTSAVFSVLRVCK